MCETFMFLNILSFACIGVSDAIEEALLLRFTQHTQQFLITLALSASPYKKNFLYRITDNSLKKIRQPPIFPGRLQPSIVGRISLNLRVRDGNGCDPDAHRHRKYVIVLCARFSYTLLRLPILQNSRTSSSRSACSSYTAFAKSISSSKLASLLFPLSVQSSRLTAEQ